MFSIKSALRHYCEYLKGLDELIYDDNEYLEYKKEHEIRIFEENGYKIYICFDLKEHIPAYSHVAIFDLSYPITFFIIHDSFYHLFLCCDIASQPTNVITSFLSENDSLYFNTKKFDIDDTKLESFTKEYKNYLHTIEDWINNNIIHFDDNDYVKYKRIPYSELSKAEFDLSLFTDDSLEISKALQNFSESETTSLCNVADVIKYDDPFWGKEYTFGLNQEGFRPEDSDTTLSGFAKLCEEILESCERKAQSIDNNDLIILSLNTNAIYSYDWHVGTNFTFGWRRVEVSFKTTARDAKNDIVIPIEKYFDGLCSQPYVQTEEEINGTAIGELFIKLLEVKPNSDTEIKLFQRVYDNDIIFNESEGTFRLVKNESLSKRANKGEYIIRPKNINPYFLIKYLNSNLFKRIKVNKKIGQPVNGFNLTGAQLKNALIIIPSKESDKFYQNLYNLDILDASPIDKYIKPGNSKSTLEALLQKESFDAYLKMKRNEVATLIQSDLDELTICVSNKAYKAALILAGSIMETVLLEWLSEKDGKNYFKEPLIINDIKDNSDRRATLVDYINLVKELEKPNWMVTAEKAHYIREQRNLVHAKLCMDTKNEINRDTCKKVLRYLNEIIESYLNSKLC